MPITHEVTPEMEAYVAALTALVGDLPTADLPELDKFGKLVKAGKFTDHRDHGVQEAMFELRNIRPGQRPPSYWAIAHALGCRHSADTEAGTHAHARRVKADESWKLDVAARATMLRKAGQEVRPVQGATVVTATVPEAPVKAKATAPVKGKATAKAS